MGDLEQQMRAALRDDDQPEVDRLAALLDVEDAERDRRLSQPGALAQAAAWYATQDLHVFPVQPRDKKPYPGSRGFKDASTDPDQIIAWWRERPDSNIGIATGHLVDVIDIDGPPGYLSFADLRDQELIPDSLGKATTPRGGMHIYIAAIGDGNTAGIRTGIDYRGLGGYVVAAPSVGPNGRRYAWSTPLQLPAQMVAP